MKIGKTAIAIHSFKGGTGKTSLSVNLSAMLAKMGKNVCLLDFDFSGPSLHSVFQRKNEDRTGKWLNDLIDSNCTLEEALVDISEERGTKGKFYVGFADPEARAIRNQMEKGRDWQMKALSNLMSLKKELMRPNSKWKIDNLILDTSPGVQYSSINAIVAADSTLLVVKPDHSDFEGTAKMLSGIHTHLKKRSMLIVNKVPYEMLASTGDDHSLKELISSSFGGVFGESKSLEILGWIPCFCSIALGMGSVIFALESPEHPLVKNLEKHLPQIFKGNGRSKR